MVTANIITANINEGPQELVAISRAMLVGSGYTKEWAGVAQGGDQVQIDYIAQQDDTQIVVDVAGPCMVKLESVHPSLILPGTMAPFHLWSIVGAGGPLRFRIIYSIGGLDGTATSVIAGAMAVYQDYSWWIGGLHFIRVASEMLDLAWGVAHAWHPRGEARVVISPEGWTLELCDRSRIVFSAKRQENKMSCVWKTWDDLDPTDPVVRRVYGVPELPSLPMATSPFGDAALIAAIADWASS